jgi:ATP-binding cassette subfamily B protein
VVDAGISLATRWFSARIGEGVIYDLRSRVFEHVQRMPVAFFTRTQTGALVSRLNNDVIGAQQAFTSTLSGVLSNVIGLVLTAGVMFTLSWQITALSLVLVPVFVLPARRIGRRLQEITRESYGLNASMNASMTERFNVAGRLLVKLFGRPEAEAEASAAGRRGCATSASCRPCTAHLLHRADPRRRRWPPRWSTASAAGWPSPVAEPR